MGKEFSRAFYNSAAWQICRSSYWRSRGGLCEDCLERGEITPGVDVHHVTPLSPENIGDPNITLNWDNLRLLCRDCHMSRHSSMNDDTKAGRKRNPRRYEIDPYTGRVETR